jgi:arylsulfatase A-like enzyme
MKLVGRIAIGALIALRCSTALGAPGPQGFPAVLMPPAGAPNVLIVMTDDVGYAASSTFGGAIPTPTLDALAADGLRYNNFHTTALCSPTRAALLTGRNHHAVGFGSVADLAQGEPGYTSIIPKSAATFGQILSAAGYDTAWFGKNHNVPTWQAGPLGPFDQWASGLGFRYFYGFNAGLTNQFAPTLVENNTMIEPQHQPGYILDRDLADHAVSWLSVQRAQSAGRRPFLLYYAPGTAHAPIQAPPEWITRFKGKFDQGWDVLRQEIFARQKRMGIIPADAKLNPLPANVKPWASLSADEKRVSSRYMEAYAAMLAYCDNQIGRIIDALKASGQLDNTLVIFIEGDNGASPEGGAIGTYDYASELGAGGSPGAELAHALAHVDDIGGPRSFSVGPVGWAVAMDTPFPYYKLVASHLGGTTNGMVVSWPAKIKARGLRSQFTDITDVVPTLLEAIGIPAPSTFNGTAQLPFDGTSFAYSFEHPTAVERHTTQYFEIFGNTAIYQDGWMASEPVLQSGRAAGMAPDTQAPWELYDLRHDFAQATDIAAAHPGKLAELRATFQGEAARNHVLPLVTSNLAALLPQSRPEVTAAAGHYVFIPSPFRYPEGTFPAIANRSWSIAADLDVLSPGDSGVLVTQGGRFSGWGLVMLKGVPTFLYRASDDDKALVSLAAPTALTIGHHDLALDFTVDGPGLGRGGGYVMRIDGAAVTSLHVDSTVPFKFAPEDAAIGHDTGTPLVDDYQPPFPYQGALHSVAITLGPVQLRPAPAKPGG